MSSKFYIPLIFLIITFAAFIQAKGLRAIEEEPAKVIMSHELDELTIPEKTIKPVALNPTNDPLSPVRITASKNEPKGIKNSSEPIRFQEFYQQSDILVR